MQLVVRQICVEGACIVRIKIYLGLPSIFVGAALKFYGVPVQTE